MQEIILENREENKKIEDILSLYEYFSYKGNNEDTLFPINLDLKMKKFFELVNKNVFEDKKTALFEDRNNSYQLINPDNKKVLVFFSGGKDSCYTSWKLSKLGYEVILYSIDKINKSYHDEIYSARKCAEIMKMKLIVENVTLKGKSDFLENPIKNQVIYSMGVNYGLKNGIINYAMGNSIEDTISKSNKDRDFSDSLETIKTFNDCLSNIYGVKINNISIIDRYFDSIIWFGRHRELWNCCQSCLTPIRYRKHLKENNEKKFNIKLFSTDCGSCWKDCVQYILFMDFNFIPFNKEFYLHCLDVLRKKAKSELQSFSAAKNNKELYLDYIDDEIIYNKSKLKEKNL